MPERHFPQDKVPEGVDAELIDDGIGINDVPSALGHLLAVHGPPAMRKDGGGERSPQCHEDGRPIDGVGGENVFSDEMQRGGPEAGWMRGSTEISRAREVVYERIEPHIGHIVAVEGQLDAPGEPRLRPRDGQVFQWLL